MRILAVASALAFAALSFAGEKITLTRTYKADEKVKYTTKVDMQDDQTEITAELLFSIKKIDKDSATGELSMTKMSMLRAGSSVMDGVADKVSDKWSKNGVGELFEARNETIPYALLHVMSFVPAKEIEENVGFDVKWKGRNDGTFAGKGTLLSIKEIDGKRVALVEYSIEATPDGENHPGILKVKCQYDTADGKLLVGEGTLQIGDMLGKVSVRMEGWKG